MGCRAILLDVSPTALRIAREHYRRYPVVGEQPPPAFLEFDGRRIDLPDGSVDRIVCFDAFHHAPNPHAVIGEFGRVLGAGGIAGFVEPGPRHAEAPRSRFESQTYGVVERDVDVHDIWRAARARGFADLRMCVFHAPPHHVSLPEYEDLLAGGGTAGGEWLASTRRFLRHVRTFYLVKEGAAPADSRSVAGLACEIRAALSGSAESGAPLEIDAAVTNSGSATWLPSGDEPGGVVRASRLADGAHRFACVAARWSLEAGCWSRREARIVRHPIQKATSLSNLQSPISNLQSPISNIHRSLLDCYRDERAADRHVDDPQRGSFGRQ
jgi:SAM-dependent methyltransferase